MIKLYLTFFLLLTVQLSKAQGPDPLSYYLKGLNWDSFRVVSHYANTSVSLDNNAEKMVALGKSINFYDLVASMDQSDKTVAIHAILTKIYDPKNFSVKIRTIFKKGRDGKKDYLDPTGGEVISLNGLSWVLKYGKGVNSSRYFLDKDQIQKMKTYWKRKMVH